MKKQAKHKYLCVKCGYCVDTCKHDTPATTDRAQQAAAKRCEYHKATFWADKCPLCVGDKRDGAQHSPVPWKAIDRNECIGIYCKAHKSAIAVAEYDFRDDDKDTQEETRANAALIAAAPELLAACHAPNVDKAHDKLSELVEYPLSKPDDIRKAAVNLCIALVKHDHKRKMAIAKAEGRANG